MIDLIYDTKLRRFSIPAKYFVLSLCKVFLPKFWFQKNAVFNQKERLTFKIVKSLPFPITNKNWVFMYKIV